MSSPGMKFARALDGLIRSRTRGDGGRQYADKCIREMGEALDEMNESVKEEVGRELSSKWTAGGMQM